MEKSENIELKISLEKIIFALVSVVEYGDPFTAKGSDSLRCRL